MSIAKRILYITPWEPNINTGGGRHCYYNLLSLSKYNNTVIDYIGPSISDNVIKDIKNIDNIYSRKIYYIDKLKCLLNKEISSVYGIFIEHIKRIRSKYEVVFVESTRCGFAFRNNIKYKHIICCSHNVEYDYLYYNTRVIPSFYRKRAYESEYISLKKADIILAMHEDDIARYKEVYNNIADNKYVLHPVCYNRLPAVSTINIKNIKNIKIVTIIASLDGRYNEKGIIDFVNNVWANISYDKCILRIAGRNPQKPLLSLLKNYSNIEIIANPVAVEDLIKEAYIIVLPDIYGFGMKLRVAEAMAYGIPIVGTNKGLKGYKEINKYAFNVQSIKDMLPIINTVLDSNETIMEMSKQAQVVWKKEYSYEVYRSRINKILANLL